MTGIRVIPVEVEPAETLVSPVHTVRTLSPEESTFRQNLKRKLRTVSCKKTAPQIEIKKMCRFDLPKKKRLSLNIETAKQSQVSQCVSSKEQSPIIRSDAYLSSTLVSNEPPELEIGKSVATQVIKVNPNALFRDTSLLNISPPAGMDYSWSVSSSLNSTVIYYFSLAFANRYTYIVSVGLFFFLLSLWATCVAKIVMTIVTTLVLICIYF